MAELRAKAHPLRLRMLSLLTGAPMSAAELARELEVSQALASYHLRQLHAAGTVDLVEERTNRGGKERCYRYSVPTHAPRGASARVDLDVELEGLIAELRRRAAGRADPPGAVLVDAELWLRPEDWEEARDAIRQASIVIHERARPPHEDGTLHVNTSVAMFKMAEP